jgi:hypothetical protein
VADRGEPRIAFLMGCASLLDQSLSVIVQLLEFALTFGEHIQERAKK